MHQDWQQCLLLGVAVEACTTSIGSRRAVRSASTCNESCSMTLHSKSRMHTALNVARIIYAVHCDRLTHLDNVLHAAEDCTS